MQTAFAQKREHNKSVEPALSNQIDSRVDLKEETATEAGMPFFLQRFAASSLSTPPPVQRQPIEEDKEQILQTRPITPFVQREVLEEDEEENAEVNSVSSSVQRQIDDEEEEFNQETPVLPKLAVGASDDEYEQEADHVADKVMRMPDSNTSQVLEEEEEKPGQNDVIRTKPITPLYIQRVCSECDNELQQGTSSPPNIQTKSEGSFSASKKVAKTLQSPGIGSSLPEHVRSKVESALGSDLSHVKVHSDTHSNQAAQSINAKAFTHGSNIFLGKGQSANDVGLMAHESTHVVQQGGQNKYVNIQKIMRATPSIEKQSKSAADQAKTIKGALVEGWTSNEDEQEALDQLKGQSYEMISSVNKEYLKLGRVLWSDFREYADRTIAIEAISLLFPTMSLHTKLYATESSEGILDVLKYADNKELLSIRNVIEVKLMLKSRLNDDQMYQVRKRFALAVQDKSESENLKVEAAIERIKAAHGFWNDEEDAVYDVLLDLTTIQRETLWENHKQEEKKTGEGLFSFLDDDEIASVEKICTGTIAQALQERLRIATEGAGTDDEAIASIVSKVGVAARREAQIKKMLDSNVDESSRPLSVDRRQILIKELNKLGGIHTNLLEPERLLLHLKTGTFLEMMRDDISPDEYQAYAKQMGVIPLERAKQQVLDAIGLFTDDEDKVLQAIEQLPPDLRGKILDDWRIRLQLHRNLSGEERERVNKYIEGNSYTIALDKIRDAFEGVNTNEMLVIELLVGFVGLSPKKDRDAFKKEPLWEDIRTSSAFSETERMILSQVVYGSGEIPKKEALDYAVGRMVTKTHPKGGQVRTLEGGEGGAEMFSLWVKHLKPHERAKYRLGYYLSGENIRDPKNPVEWQALVNFLDLEQRMSDRFGTDDFQRLLDELLGDPTIEELRTEEGRRQIIEILTQRVREKQNLQGSVADWFTMDDETVDAAAIQFLSLYNKSLRLEKISRSELAMIASLSNLHSKRYESYVQTVDMVARIAGTVAAVAAGIVVVVLSGGSAAPLVGSALAKWSVIGATAGAVARVGVSEVVGGSHYEATGTEGGMDLLVGGIEGATAVLSASLAFRFAHSLGLSQKALSAKLTETIIESSREALAHSGRRMAGGSIEGIIDGFLSGAVGELVMTAADQKTWEKGVWDALVSMGEALLRGGFIGAGTGAIFGGGIGLAGGVAQSKRIQRIFNELTDLGIPPSRLRLLDIDTIESLGKAYKELTTSQIAAIWEVKNLAAKGDIWAAKEAFEDLIQQIDSKIANILKDSIFTRPADVYLPKELRPDWSPEMLSPIEKRALEVERYGMRIERKQKFGERLRELNITAEQERQLTKQLREIADELNLDNEEVADAVFTHIIDRIQSNLKTPPPSERGLGRRMTARNIIDNLLRNESELEGFVLKAILAENIQAINAIRSRILAIDPDAILAVERGGVFLADVLAYQDTALESIIRRVSKGPEGQRTHELEEVLRTLIKAGKRKFVVVDVYMGGHASSELRKMYRKLLNEFLEYPDLSFESIWMREKFGFERNATSGVGLTPIASGEHGISEIAMPVKLALGDDMDMIFDPSSQRPIRIFDKQGKIVQEITLPTRDPITGETLKTPREVLIRLMRGVKFPKMRTAGTIAPDLSKINMQRLVKMELNSAKLTEAELDDAARIFDMIEREVAEAASGQAALKGYYVPAGADDAVSIPELGIIYGKPFDLSGPAYPDIDRGLVVVGKNAIHGTQIRGIDHSLRTIIRHEIGEMLEMSSLAIWPQFGDIGVSHWRSSARGALLPGTTEAEKILLLKDARKLGMPSKVGLPLAKQLGIEQAVYSK